MFISLLISCVLLNFVSGQSDQVCLTFSRPGVSACNPNEIEELRKQISELSESIASLNLLKHQHTDKVAHCSVGMKDGRVRDADTTASTFWDVEYVPHLARLDNQKQGTLTGAWAAGILASNQLPRIGDWIQVDLKSPTFVTGVVTQGRPASYLQWVTSYKISYGNSTDKLQIMERDGSDFIFQGNRDRETKVTNMFPQPVVARYLRLLPQTWYRHISMRLEYLTC